MCRNLAIAATIATATALGAAPAMAQGKTDIVRSDTWKPGFMKTENGDYMQIVPESETEAAGYPVDIIRSDTWQPGYRKTDDGDYVMLAPSQEMAQGEGNVEIIRSDTWQPGFMKSEEGDYVKLVETD